MNTTDLKSFNYLENGEVSFSCFDTVKSNKKLDSGSYKVSYLEYPENRVLLKMDEDKETVRIHNFPDKAKIDALFSSFFDNRVVKKISTLGFYHKLGVLLYGKEGTGKSTILKHYYTSSIRKNNALVFHITCTDRNLPKCWAFIMNVRRIQDNPIIVVFEELDAFIHQSENEAFLKTVLDGNMSINNCIFLATTNYLELIPEAMKSRPSRFKYVLNIEGIKNKEDVFLIVKSMLTDIVAESEMYKFAADLTGETLDTIKQFCIDKIMSIRHFPVQKKSNPIGFIRREEPVYE